MIFRGYVSEEEARAMNPEALVQVMLGKQEVARIAILTAVEQAGIEAFTTIENRIEVVKNSSRS